MGAPVRWIFPSLYWRNYSGAPSGPKSRRAEPHTLRKLTDPCFGIFMVIMDDAFGFSLARGHVRRRGPRSCPNMAPYPRNRFKVMVNAIWDIHVMVNWQLSNQGIRWPVSHDHIAGSHIELIEVECFFEVYRWPNNGFHWIVDSSAIFFLLLVSKLGAPLLGLAKSIYLQWWRLFVIIKFIVNSIKYILYYANKMYEIACMNKFVLERIAKVTCLNSIEAIYYKLTTIYLPWSSNFYNPNIVYFGIINTVR